MHIVSVNYQFPALSETFVLNQITGLIQRGHRVTPWCQTEGDWTKAHADVARYGLRRITRVTPPDLSGWNGVRLWLGLLLSHPTRALRLWKNRRRVLRRGAQEMLRIALSLGAIRRVDIYHCQFGNMGEMVLWLRNHRLIGPVPVITTFHGHDIRAGLAGEAKYPLLLAARDPVIAISAYSMARLQELGFPAGRLRRIPVSIDLSRFPSHDHPRSGPVRVLTVARMVEEKNLELALDVLRAALDEMGPDACTLTLVGDGPLRAELDGWIRERNLTGQVTCTGALAQDAVVSLYASHQIFLLTSRAENLPVSIMEASASGLPVIATRVGSVDELVLAGTTGLLAESGDRETLTRHLLRLLREEETGTAFGRAARHHITDNFNLASWVTELASCFRASCVESVEAAS